MSKIKVIIDFTDYTTSELLALARTIHERFAQHSGVFPNPPITVDAVGALVEDYAQKIVDRQTRAAADVLALKQARTALEQALRMLGSYVNTVSQGRAAIAEKSGFPSFATARPRDFSPPAAPANLRLRHLTLAGGVLARYVPPRRRGANEVQITIGDPNDESTWKIHGYFPGGLAELTGQPSGAIIWVRVRAVGLRGVMGAWSDPAQIRVL